MKAAQNREVYCSKSSDFSRATVLTFPRVALALTNMMKRSLAVELADFFGTLGADDQLFTKSAFSQARQKLKPVFLKIGTNTSVSAFIKTMIKTYADGTTFDFRGWTVLLST